MNALKNLIKSVEGSTYVNFDGVRAWTTDPAVEMEVRVEEGQPSRPVAFPCRVLAGLLESADVEISLKDDQLRVSRPGFLAEVRTAEATPPTILGQIEEPIARVGGDFVKTFRSALPVGRVSIYTTKVLVEVGDGVKVVATDGYRLHIHSLEAEVYREARIHLPTTASEAFRILSRDEPLTLYGAWTGKALVIESPSARAGLALADPHYPDYRKAIPTEPPKGQIQAPRRELIRALRRVLPVAEPRNRAVRLSVQDGLCVEALDDSLSPVSRETLPGEGQEQVFVNATYLVDALEEITGDAVHIALYARATATLLEVKDERFYALISTLRTPQNPPSEG